jgi:hypothetical protein
MNSQLSKPTECVYGMVSVQVCRSNKSNDLLA